MHDVIFAVHERDKQKALEAARRVDYQKNSDVEDLYLTWIGFDYGGDEKMAATIGRNKPRDHYDLSQIIKQGQAIDLEIVKRKCEQSGVEFDIISMFNRAKKLHKRWNEDLLPLIVNEITFQEVMCELTMYFELNKVKAKRKKSKTGT